MKVLLLSDTHSPHTEKWALGLAGAGIKVGLFSFNKAADEWYHHENITVFFEPPSSINAESTITKLSYIKYVRILKKIIRHFEPDILHAHYATSYGLIGALAGYKPFILSVWGSDVYNFPVKSKFHRKILQFNLKKADVLLSTSLIMKEELKKYTGRQVKVTPFGVDVNAFVRNNSFAKNDGMIRVGTIKPIQEKYGIIYIIEAAEILMKEGRINNLRFYLVGEGNLEYYRKVIGEKDLQSYFEITGRVPFSEINRYHNLLDIFLNVSVEDSESFGVAAVEAMACEKPVIVSDVGGLMEVVNQGEFGRIVKRRDARALAEAIVELAADGEVRAELGRKARQQVLKHYHWQHNLEHMIAIYRSVLDHKKLAAK